MTRAKRMMVRFTPRQFELIEQLAKKEALNPSTYVRRAAIIFANRNNDLPEKMKQVLEEV